MRLLDIGGGFSGIGEFQDKFEEVENCGYIISH